MAGTVMPAMLFVLEFLEVVGELPLQTLNLLLNLLDLVYHRAMLLGPTECYGLCSSQKGDGNEWNVETHCFDWIKQLITQ